MESKLKLSCVYIVAQDFERSVNFYTKLLQRSLDKRYKNRWAQIRVSETLVLGIFSEKFDQEFIDNSRDIYKHYDENFINNLETKYETGNRVVLNLGTEDIEKEYKRIKELKVKEISPMQYVNFMFPYNFFIIKDPDGNTIEIADSV
jgi:predicted enzyme related to lactoylglutathione lyase